MAKKKKRGEGREGEKKAEKQKIKKGQQTGKNIHIADKELIFLLWSDLYRN